jgi:hypothetical protein
MPRKRQYGENPSESKLNYFDRQATKSEFKGDYSKIKQEAEEYDQIIQKSRAVRLENSKKNQK